MRNCVDARAGRRAVRARCRRPPALRVDHRERPATRRRARPRSSIAWRSAGRPPLRQTARRASDCSVVSRRIASIASALVCLPDEADQREVGDQRQRDREQRDPRGDRKARRNQPSTASRYPAPRTVWRIGVGEAVLELAAQAADMDVDHVRARVEMIVPDLLEHHRARDDLAGVAGEEFEQVEFARAERDRAAGARDGAGEQVDLEIADRRAGSSAARSRRDRRGGAGLDPCGEFGEREGLAQIVVGAGLAGHRRGRRPRRARTGSGRAWRCRRRGSR